MFANLGRDTATVIMPQWDKHWLLTCATRFDIRVAGIANSCTLWRRACESGKTLSLLFRGNMMTFRRGDSAQFHFLKVPSRKRLTSTVLDILVQRHTS